MTALSRAAIRRLRVGVVPSWEIERLSVGYSRARIIIGDALDALLSRDRATAMFVRGEWGSGKSHFLSFVSGIAVGRGFAAARVDLNARSAPLNYPQRFYGTVVQTLRAGDHIGLRAILHAGLNDEVGRQRIAKFASSRLADDIAWPLQHLCTRYEKGDTLQFDDEASWSVLHGEDLSWADYSYKRIRAIARIGTLGALMDALGHDGLVIAFDEAETIDQLWNIRSRLSAYGVLGQICRLDAVWCVFGITERFDRTVNVDIAGGVGEYDFLTADARWFVREWLADRFVCFEPPAVSRAAAERLAAAISQLYGVAYGPLRLPAETIDDCVDEWAANPSKNPRRLVRQVIARLDAARPIGMLR